MRLSARVDYALRAVLELAESGGTAPVTADRIARAQEIPPKFCESILLQLRRGGIVYAQRGPEGGYWLAKPVDQMTLLEIIEVIDGPLGSPRAVSGSGPLAKVWAALEDAERRILSEVTIAHVVSGELPVALV
ncbi:RrF2 family transcriptional regulator [Allorhizocola rhizosphaerae]|uniref:RrF2 family transcriptional regulator n=1 Tax=Allorhizocola rhizosphaerae TaxID=1872709 RepID=UPI000E3BA796|nr:Rrf2 family transcriptional regulator [Allorhizocola rhizosphaerae]